MRLTKRPKSDPLRKPWTVRVVAKYPKIEGEECWGYCDHVENEIVIARGACKKGLGRSVLLHEILHGLFPFLKEDVVEQAEEVLEELLDFVESHGILDL